MAKQRIFQYHFLFGKLLLQMRFLRSLCLKYCMAIGLAVWKLSGKFLWSRMADIFHFTVSITLFTFRLWKETAVAGLIIMS